MLCTEKKLKTCFIVSFALCVVFSTLNHFLYELSGGLKLFSPFVPISESIWEHTKLTFFPYAFTSLIISAICGFSVRSAYAFSVGIAALPIMMISAFYTYTGIIGKHFLVVDISITFITLALSHFLSYRLLRRDAPAAWLIAPATVAALIVLYFIATVYVIDLPLFLPPQ